MINLSREERDLNNIFSALAHPVRRNMLDHLKKGKATVKELADPFQMSAPAITKHLKTLEKASLITREKDGQWIYSKIQLAPLQKVSNWLEEYRVMWNDRLDRLEDYIEELKKEENESNKEVKENDETK